MLAPGIRIPHGCPAGDFASRAGGGRDGDNREGRQRVPARAVFEIPFDGLKAVSTRGNHLGGVDRGSTPQGDDNFRDRPGGAEQGAGLGEHVEVRVRDNIVDRERGRTGGDGNALGDVMKNRFVIGDEAIGAAVNQVADRVERAGAEPDPDRIFIGPHVASPPSAPAGLFGFPAHDSAEGLSSVP